MAIRQTCIIQHLKLLRRFTSYTDLENLEHWIFCASSDSVLVHKNKLFFARVWQRTRGTDFVKHQVIPINFSWAWMIYICSIYSETSPAILIINKCIWFHNYCRFCLNVGKGFQMHWFLNGCRKGCHQIHIQGACFFQVPTGHNRVTIEAKNLFKWIASCHLHFPFHWKNTIQL